MRGGNKGYLSDEEKKLEKRQMRALFKGQTRHSEKIVQRDFWMRKRKVERWLKNSSKKAKAK
jgi:hypothetical protein